MPFVRFSRDKRGYEHVYLVDASQERGRSRVLYWFRTPPGVKVGRAPFDPATQRSLERQYPEVRFDWPQIVAARIAPPVLVESWREKRRAERAIKRARAAEAAEAAGLDQPAVADAPELPEIDEQEESSDEPLINAVAELVDSSAEGLADPAAEVPEVEETPPSAARPTETSGPRRGRRRRRRGRRSGDRPGPAAQGAVTGGANGPLDPSNAPEKPNNEG